MAGEREQLALVACVEARTGLAAWPPSNPREFAAPGPLRDTLTCDGYGNGTSGSDAANWDRYKYAARKLDSVTRLQSNRARWDDPKAGRWTSQDPLGFDAGDANRYRYVANRPTDRIDPSGLVSRPLTEDDLKNAREELKAKKKDITPEEVELRLQIVRNAARGIVDVPSGDKDQMRNPKFWNDRGKLPYIPYPGMARRAVEDLWNPLDEDSGKPKLYTEKILCTKLVGLTILKSYIDLAEAAKDEATLKELDKAMDGKVLPYLGKPIVETHKNEAGYKPEDLLPGDQVWFDNPYYDLLSDEQKEEDAYLGDDGSNNFYVGKGLFIRIYPDDPKVASDVHFVYDLKAYQDRMRDWNSVKYAIKHQKDKPYSNHPELFPVTPDKFRIQRRNVPLMNPWTVKR
jgi:RHS repeat-associated protein